MSHRKDTDYLSISTRIHYLETKLLNRERMERMIEAKEDPEAFKVLEECGYTAPAGAGAAEMEGMLAQERDRVFRELSALVPEKSLVAVFQLKYDYHNAKVLVKSRHRGSEPERLLLTGGRYDPGELLAAWNREELGLASPIFRQALHEAGRMLSENGDAQQADLILDRACYAELCQLAKDSGSPYLQSYARLSVDAANLRTAVRCLRMGQDSEFLTRVLLPGGSVSPQSLIAAKGEGLRELYRHGPLEQAAEEGAKLTQGSEASLTAFERLCDDAMTEFLSRARRIPFGEEPVVGYLYAKEAEMTAVRTILSSRQAGLDADTIRSRLRAAYA